MNNSFSINAIATLRPGQVGERVSSHVVWGAWEAVPRYEAFLVFHVLGRYDNTVVCKVVNGCCGH